MGREQGATDAFKIVWEKINFQQMRRRPTMVAVEV